MQCQTCSNLFVPLHLCYKYHVWPLRCQIFRFSISCLKVFMISGKNQAKTSISKLFKQTILFRNIILLSTKITTKLLGAVILPDFFSSISCSKKNPSKNQDLSLDK